MIGHVTKKMDKSIDKINDCNDNISKLIDANLRIIEEMNQFIDKLEKHIRGV